MQTSVHDSHPDIIAWPTLSNESIKLLSTLSKQTQQQKQYNSSSNKNTNSVIQTEHVKSVSPEPNFFATLSTPSPFISQQTSPVPFRNEQKTDLAKEEANLLTMFRAAVSSSPSEFY